MYACSYNPALLVLYWCVCGLVECVEESEGLRRDGAWEYDVLQQRAVSQAAGEAPLHEPPHVCLLILLPPAQARTRRRQERTVRKLVRGAEQVREMQAARASYDAR
jgi:hypothetical protein